MLGKRKLLVGVIICLVTICSIFIFLYYFSVPKKEEITRNFLSTYLKKKYHPSNITLTYGKTPWTFWKPVGQFYGFLWNTENEMFYLVMSYNNDNKTLSYLAIIVYPQRNASIEDYLILPSNLNWNCSLPAGVNLPPGGKSCRASFFEGKARIDVEEITVENISVAFDLYKIYPESEVYEFRFGWLKE